MTPFLWLIAVMDTLFYGYALFVLIRWLVERRSTAHRNIKKLKRDARDLLRNSASPQMNTNHYLNTREDVAQFVSDLQSRASDWRLITIINPVSFEGYFASCVIRESSGREVRVYLSRRLLTSLTPLQLLSLESVLQRAGRRNKDEAGLELGGSDRGNDG